MVSVIVPIYNKEKYLKRCIESILQQHFSDLEIILVDDGSTDNSYDICEKYVHSDNRVQAFLKKNGGVSSARNFGIDISHGDYITFVDPDDYIHPELISSLMECLLEKCADISYCFPIDFNENSTAMITMSHESGNKTVIEPRRFDWMGWSSHTVVWGALFKREVVKTIRFDETLAIGEDTYFFSKCIKKAERLVCLDKALYYYSSNDDSVTGEKNSPRKMDELRAWEMLCEQFDGNSFSYRTAKAGYAQIAKNIIRKNCNDYDFMRKNYCICKKVWYKNFACLFGVYLHEHEWILALKSLFAYVFWNAWLQRQKSKV